MMDRIPVRVLILPKFETGAMSGDFPGEAQFFYEHYCAGGQAYEISGGFPGHKLYVKDGVALYVTGIGKVNAVLSLMAVLRDPRFDFSDAYFLSVGCGGSSYGSTVMGDVILATAAVDYDLGHHADPRELTRPQDTTWFHDPIFDSSAFRVLDAGLMDWAWERIRDTKLETTPRTRVYLEKAFGPCREPMVLRGTTVSGDNYWKGEAGHRNAVQMAITYGCPDPYAVCEMEDAALAVALDRMGLLDRFLVIRASVNMDGFLNGMTPETLWDADLGHGIAAEESVESADIFATAMENEFRVGRILVDGILREK